MGAAVFGYCFTRRARCYDYGGLGVAFFSPIDQQRYFFSFRPIQVFPIGIRNFAGQQAVRVLVSEVVWVGLPCLVLLLINWLLLLRSQPLEDRAG